MVDVLFENALDKSDVFIVSDSTAVVDLRAEEVNDLVRDLRVLIQEHLKLLLADIQVFIGELVGNIPSNRTELSPVLDDSVEETEAEEKFLELCGLYAVLEFLL